MAGKISYWWQKVVHWLLGEEGEIALNVEELKTGLQAQREACTRLLALALQAKKEIEASLQRKVVLHEEAMSLIRSGLEDLALAKSDEEAQLDQDILVAKERFAKLQTEADMQWQLYQQKALEVKKRIEQARHLKVQVEVNRLRERAQVILDSSDFSSALSKFDTTAKNIELAGIMNDARAALEAELKSPQLMLAKADDVLARAKRQERLAALKQEALPPATSVTTGEVVADGEARQPETVKVEKTI